MLSSENRYQLIIRNVENFAEYATAPFSRAGMLTAVLLWFGISFGMSLWLAKTVLARWMNPVYIETRNQEKITYLAATIEQLEQQIESQAQFIAILQDTMQYKPQSSQLPHKPQSSQLSPVIPDPTPPPTTPPITEEAPSKTQDNLPTNLTTQSAPATHLLFAPTRGIVTNPFDKKNGHYAVDIVAKEKAPIKAIAAGVVIFAEWSVDTGWVIIIQHYNNWVSICKHCAILFKKVGNLVKAGDVIALIGNSGELSKGTHLHFELWNEGVALNPESFIKF